MKKFLAIITAAMTVALVYIGGKRSAVREVRAEISKSSPSPTPNWIAERNRAWKNPLNPKK